MTFWIILVRCNLIHLPRLCVATRARLSFLVLQEDFLRVGCRRFLSLVGSCRVCGRGEPVGADGVVERALGRLDPRKQAVRRRFWSGLGGFLRCSVVAC